MRKGVDAELVIELFVGMRLSPPRAMFADGLLDRGLDGKLPRGEASAEEFIHEVPPGVRGEADGRGGFTGGASSSSGIETWLRKDIVDPIRGLLANGIGPGPSPALLKGLLPKDFMPGRIGFGGGDSSS